jgi:hypothetical protein
MDTDRREDAEDTPLADGTGMERPNDLPAMESGDAESRRPEASGDEKTAVEGASGLGATNRAFGAGSITATGGIGTNVPTDEDEAMNDSTDPRGY